jgi:CTP:molybdopterin cytidylyltransferase MocA
VRKVAAILLAAGGSRRMGEPKQLLELEGEPLVRRAARAALETRCARVLVVTGAAGGEVEAALAGLDVEVVRNPVWETGLASSIRAGLEAAQRAVPGLDGVLVLLADQPRVGRALLERLLDAFERPGVQRVACAYAGGRGVPAVLGMAHFAALAALRGDRGAKALVDEEGEDLVSIESDEPATDVDTPDDLRALRRGARPTALPAALREFLAEHSRAYILSLRPDGSPTAHPMTALVGGGDGLVFNTYRKAVKARNVARDPRVAAVYLDGYDKPTPRGFVVEGRGELRQADQLPAARGRSAGPVSESVASRASARLQSGKRVLIDIEPVRVRPLEGA